MNNKNIKGEILLEIKNLKIQGFSDEKWHDIVNGVDISLRRGEVMGLIGESGAGKSTLGLAAMGYTQPGCRITDGEIKFYGVDLAKLKENEKRKSFGVFLIYLMKEKLIPVLRILNIIVAFQTAVIEYIDVENKTEIVDEITEILFLLLKEGKETFMECKAEWIWKFVIKQNVETFSKYTKKDKKSLKKTKIKKNLRTLWVRRKKKN